MIRVAAFTKYDRLAASTRQRVLQYGPALREAGFELRDHPLLGDDYVASLVSRQPVSRARIALAYARRLRELLADPACDLIWIYAELFPYLPAAFERLAFRSGKAVVYDLDDAFFLPYETHRSSVVRRLLSGKLDLLMRRAAACTCGNPFLLDHAKRLNPNSVLLPTVVDTDRYVPRPRPEGPLTIGWIGSPTTWSNARPLLPLLQRLVEDKGVRVRVVGAGRAAEADACAGVEFVPWREESEIAEVQRFDIGIMPLADGPFERGKSGYKLVQYMACGVPVVASPVGVNRDIVTPEVGLLASGERDWADALTRLIDDVALRLELGQAGRERAVRDYSLGSQAPRLIALFREVLGSR
jgi:hypothetical protein